MRDPFIYTPDMHHQTHPACRSSFWSDRAHGLIYGPYAVQFAGIVRPANPSLAAAVSGDCTYCNNPLHPITLRRLRTRLASYIMHTRTKGGC